MYETERLYLKNTDEEDADMILELYNSPKWIEYIGERDVKTLEDAKKYIREKMMPQYDRLGYSNNTLIRKSDNVKLGSCGLYDREGLEGVDIGFALLPAYEGRGYAHEAASKVLEVGIEKFDIKKVSAITLERNAPSRRLIEKLGLKFKEMIKLPEDDEEVMLFEMIIEA